MLSRLDQRIREEIKQWEKKVQRTSRLSITCSRQVDADSMSKAIDNRILSLLPKTPATWILVTHHRDYHRTSLSPTMVRCHLSTPPIQRVSPFNTLQEIDHTAFSSLIWTSHPRVKWSRARKFYQVRIWPRTWVATSIQGSTQVRQESKFWVID